MAPRLQNRLAELMAEYNRKMRRKPQDRLTQQELSKETGITQKTISAYVTNKVTRYDADIVLKFLEFFNADVSDFFVVVDEIPEEFEPGPELEGATT